jgi:pyruvate-formate lyase-activating enzyme
MYDVKILEDRISRKVCAFFKRDRNRFRNINLVIAEGRQLLLQEPTIAAIIVEEMKMVEWVRQQKTW